MKIGGKVQNILQQKNYVTYKDLRKLYDQNEVKSYMFEYGLRNPNLLICSTMAQHKINKKIISGTTKMADVLFLQKSSNYQIKCIVPLGIIKQGCNIEALVQESKSQLIQKIGVLCPKKLTIRPPVVKEMKNSKAIINKKQSQKNIQINNNNGGKKNCSSNVQKNKQIGKCYQKENASKGEKVGNQIFGKKSLLKVSKDEDSFQEQIKKYQIVAPKAKPKSDINQMKQEKVKQLTKAAKIDFDCTLPNEQKKDEQSEDDWQGFDKLLQKTKSKPQNININFPVKPQKPQKKTTQKIQKSNNVKSISVTGTQMKGSSQSTLLNFNFMKKK